MATSHSLSSPTSHRTVAQLPFSPSNNAPRLPGINTGVSASATPSGNSPTATSPTRWTAHDRTGSVVSSRPRAQTNMSHVASELPFVPSASMPIIQPRPTTGTTHGTTHVGGILPSASFFHPSRPNHVPLSVTPPLPRPSTVGSLASIGGSTVDAVRLSQLGGSQHRDRTSEGSGSADHSIEDAKAPTIAPSLSSNKFSREPLLPISGAPKPNGATRPTIVTQTNPYGRSDSNLSAGARMRGSFEKLFKRPFSFDRSPTTPNNNPGPSSAFNHFQTGSTQVSPITFELGANGAGVEGSPTSPGHRKHSLSPLQGSTTSINHASFIPSPPHMDPPLCETPILDEKTGKPMRRYQLHPSRNRFLLGGRILTGGDSPWAFIGALTLVLTIAGVYFGTTCVWWWNNESPAVAAVGAYMCLLTISSMFATAFRDPGILPRNLDPEPPYPASSSSDGSLRQPLPRDLKVRAGIVRTKYCPTCMTYRPPRSSHCKMCDNCVDGCDHHCQWVNNCVGRRNYTVFFTFLFSGVMTLVLVITTTALHLYLVAHKFHLGFRHAIATSEGIGSAIAFSLSILVIWPVMALLSYHLRLLLLNVTTIEQIRNQAHKTLLPEGPAPPNPFSHGSWRKNLVYMLCRPTGYSWLDARAVATEDKREVNPGLLHEHDGWPGDVEHGPGRGKGE
ncbi:DHHC palmitoyltransferase-domain-containing protein [Dichomitus squalens]|uniref:Palmitoyltransferase n=1 Tax=Dichomitus squalens TaxID=114155 RepID=A0A4Q9PAJ3_9APHY|nr:DHHC palmitoyltransferase-domain-containing protein [Dichomitus squalens]TBU65546.1 DHHC palmitoyltransferase-domain-containing protein [Dichomitus squalens]